MHSLEFVTVGPDVESPSSSRAHISGTEGLLAEPEDRELYLMCLCEQQVTSVGGSKRKKGKEIFIGFLVSECVCCASQYAKR